MWLTQRERVTLIVLGALLLAGLGVHWRQSQPPPLRVLGASVAPLPAAAWERHLDAARQVDVNTADIAELERLPGVGPALAARIVAEREAHGPFASPEALTRVQGIGEKTYEAIKAHVTVAREHGTGDSRLGGH